MRGGGLGVGERRRNWNQVFRVFSPDLIDLLCNFFQVTKDKLFKPERLKYHFYIHKLYSGIENMNAACPWR